MDRAARGFEPNMSRARTFFDTASRFPGRVFMIIAASLAAFLIPTLSWAAEGENVNLRFTDSDMVYLIISGVIGALAIVFGLLIRSGVLSQDKGSEKMQEVGGAIKAGALAYLQQQVKTMVFF